jgi:hypothetical protein
MLPRVQSSTELERNGTCWGSPHELREFREIQAMQNKNVGARNRVALIEADISDCRIVVRIISDFS